MLPQSGTQACLDAMVGYSLLPESAQMTLYGSRKETSAQTSSPSSSFPTSLGKAESSTSAPMTTSPLSLGGYSASLIRGRSIRGPTTGSRFPNDVESQQHHQWRNSLIPVTAYQPTEKPLGEVLRNAGRKALGGGVPGAAAMALNVLSLMWLRTTINYQ